MRLLPTVLTLAGLIDILATTDEEVLITTAADRLKLAGYLRELEVFRSKGKKMRLLLDSALAPADVEETK